jgi:hypothetical protein
MRGANWHFLFSRVEKRTQCCILKSKLGAKLVMGLALASLD